MITDLTLQYLRCNLNKLDPDLFPPQTIVDTHSSRGSIAEVFIACGTDGRKFIVKARPSYFTESLFSKDRQEVAYKEVYIKSLVTPLGVPVALTRRIIELPERDIRPDITRYETEQNLRYTLIILDYVEGKIAPDMCDNNAHDESVMRALGRCVRTINSVDASALRNGNPAGPAAENYSAPSKLDDGVRRQVEELVTADLLTAERASVVIRKISKELSFGRSECLVHGDLNPGNIILFEDGDIKALLDWEGSRVGTIAEEFAGLIANRIFGFRVPLARFEVQLLAFIQGYGMSVGDFRSLRDVIETYILIELIEVVHLYFLQRDEKLPTSSFLSSHAGSINWEVTANLCLGILTGEDHIPQLLQ